MYIVIHVLKNKSRLCLQKKAQSAFIFRYLAPANKTTATSFLRIMPISRSSAS